MAINNVPIVFVNNQSQMVGRITLSPQIEEYLKNGFQFTIVAVLDSVSDRVVGVGLFPIPAEERIDDSRDLETNT